MLDRLSRQRYHTITKTAHRKRKEKSQNIFRAVSTVAVLASPAEASALTTICRHDGNTSRNSRRDSNPYSTIVTLRGVRLLTR